jgi:hypothetical protein
VDRPRKADIAVARGVNSARVAAEILDNSLGGLPPGRPPFQHPVPRSQYQFTGDENRDFGGIVASCEEGTISLLLWREDLVKVGCAKPTTRARCDLLFQRISDAR